MNQVSIRIAKRRKALEQISEIVNNSSLALVIHYSCESFYEITDGRTPRITSIAVRFFKTGQTKSFSIHKVAERKGVKIEDIEEVYDELEKEMLLEYFAFVKDHRAYNWIHWNMRDINYGFEAIAHRFAVLGGTPESINDENKVDLARVLVSIFGPSYIGHPHLEKLIEKNGITKKDFLAGEQEAKAFQNKEYVRLHQSTLRKVDIIHSIAEKIVEDTLKTNSKMMTMYGYTPQGIYELVKDNWIFGVIFTLIGMTLSTALSVLVSKWFSK